MHKLSMIYRKQDFKLKHFKIKTMSNRLSINGNLSMQHLNLQCKNNLNNREILQLKHFLSNKLKENLNHHREFRM